MSDRLQIRVLGPLAVASGVGPVELGGRRQRRLLTGLVVDAGSVVSSDRLIERVWTDSDLPADPLATLRTYLTRLRKALGGDQIIVTEPSGWRLDVHLVDIDAFRFVELVNGAAESGLDAHRRLGLLDEALGLWRGEAFEEVEGEDWVRAEADRLNELRVTAIERRFEAMLAAGMHTDALPGLVGEVEAHPLRDRLVGLQILALFRSGRQAEATRVFQAHRDRLADELGLEPGTELVELDRRIVASDPSLLLASTPGRALRGYRLGEQLGEGAFAVVYRGTQPSVGRDVAVKVIRSELANRPEFVRRFEAEAHLVARLEHPFIVPLYDYWREPDRACLVFRYLRGGTLEQRLSASGGLSIGDCRLMIDEVGSALTAAHRAGVVHRDVKPANVLLDEAGHFYLGDFGIALEAAELSDPTAALSAGSPAYASPEQLRREPIGPPADVHGFAISIYEALTGGLPFPSAISQADLLQRQLHDPIPLVRDHRQDVPAGVDEVLAKATAKDPLDRFQTIEELVTEFRAALDDGPRAIVGRVGAATTVSADDARNPFKGLRAFTEADAADFFGRERLVDRLVEVLARPGTEGRIAAVVGPSGIGKSSVVRAGLLPALRNGAVAGSDRWFVATMLPGRDPFEELGSALLRVATRTPENMMGQLAENHRGIARVVKAIAPEDDLGDVLLVIDQFEELFTLAEDDKVTRLFLDSLEHALTDARCPLRVVLTMRADFWDRPLRHGPFARLIDASTINVTALAPDELERAITEPAHRTGTEFEPGLVSEIVADLTDQPGALPLLQYALTELWEQQVSGLLTRDSYRQLGGVAGTLARRAEDLYLEATPEEQVAIRPMFGRLVTPGQGTEDTRRRALRAELGALDSVTSAIDRYGQARLLSFDTDPATREPTVEVAHEALIRQWPRLRQWLEDDRDGLRILLHLSASAEGWRSSDRPDAELYRGGRLEASEDWAEKHRDQLTDVERAFLTASTDLRDNEEQDERQRFERQARDNRRLRTLLSAVAVFAAVAVIAGAVAFQQRGEANDNAGRVETERIAAEVVAFAEEDVPLSLLLAVEAYRRDPGPVGLGALQTALSQSGSFLGSISMSGADAVHWIDDDTLLVTGSQGTSLVDWRSGEITALFPAPVHQITHLVGDGNTRLITVADASADAFGYVLADEPSRAEVRTVSGELLTTVEATSPIDALVMGADGLIFTLDVEGWLIATEPDGGERWRIDAHPEVVGADIDFPEGSVDPLVGQPAQELFVTFSRERRPRLLAVSEDGTTVVSIEAETVRRWETSTGKLLNEFVATSVASSGDATVLGFDNVALTPDGKGYVAVLRHLLHSADFDNPGSGPVNAVETTTAMYGNPKADDILYVEDERVLVLLSDGRVAWVETNSGVILDEVAGTLTSPRDAMLSHDGSHVAVVGPDGIVVISTRGDGLLTLGVPREGMHIGDILLDGTVTTGSSRFLPDGWQPGPWWNVNSPDPVRIEAPVDPDVPEALVGMDIDSLYIGGLTWLGNEATLHDAETKELITVLPMPGSWTGQDIRGDLALGAFGTVPGITVYALPSGEPLQVLDEPGAYAPSMHFDPDGQHLAVAGLDGELRVYDTITWEQLELNALSGVEDVRAVAFHPDGSRLITMENSGDLLIREAGSFEPMVRLAGSGRPLVADSDSFFFDPTGRYLLTSGDGSAILWDLEEQASVGVPFPNDPDFRIGGRNGPELLTAVGDWMLLWNLDIESWEEIACRAAGRNLTRSEWAQFGPADMEYRQTCPQWPEPS